MGELRNVAKKNSNFLMLEKGVPEIVGYRGYRIVPNFKDPTKDSIMYEFDVLGQVKYWTNASKKVMFFFDDLPKGTLVVILKDTFIDSAGKEDPNKSTYHVDRYQEGMKEELPANVQKYAVPQSRPIVHPAAGHSGQSIPGSKTIHHPVNNNPGQITDPANITLNVQPPQNGQDPTVEEIWNE